MCVVSLEMVIFRRRAGGGWGGDLRRTGWVAVAGPSAESVSSGVSHDARSSSAGRISSQGRGVEDIGCRPGLGIVVRVRRLIDEWYCTYFEVVWIRRASMEPPASAEG